MSRPSDPDGIASTSIDLSFLPSRMIEPLPKLRSICESAASRAFDLSMEEPSTRRSAAAVCWAIAPTPYDRDSEGRQRIRRPPSLKSQCTLFVLSSQYVLLRGASQRLASLSQGPHLDAPFRVTCWLRCSPGC